MINKSVRIGFPLLSFVLILAGCGTQGEPTDRSFIVRQVDGPTRTSFNGEIIRTRSYEGVRNYGQDNVTIFVTDSDGETVIYNNNP